MNSSIHRKPPGRKLLGLIALPAAVSIWSGWVGLGELCGFGVVQPFPGIPWLEGFSLNTAITLPIGVEAFAAYAMSRALSHDAGKRLRFWAGLLAVVALLLGIVGQSAYHVMTAESLTAAAPRLVVVFVSCLPVLVLGAAAFIGHLERADWQAGLVHESPVSPLPTDHETDQADRGSDDLQPLVHETPDSPFPVDQEMDQADQPWTAGQSDEDKIRRTTKWLMDQGVSARSIGRVLGVDHRKITRLVKDQDMDQPEPPSQVGSDLVRYVPEPVPLASSNGHREGPS